LKLVEVRPDGETSHVAGADFADGQGRAPGMKAINSMSALAAFPWVAASCGAVADDLSMLPIKVTRGRGKDAEPITDHPVLDLLDQPTSRMSGILLRRQLVTDLVLVGDAYILVAGSPEPAALIRLHPERVTVVPSADGQAAAYDYDNGGKVVRYGWDQVLHIRQVSWEDGPRGLYGNGAIRALANDLTTEQKASELAANSADHGQPTGIFSPSSEGDTWSQQQIAVMRDAFDRRMSKQGTALFLGAGVNYQPLSWSPRDMEYQATRHLVRESVMASIGVPPTRVGLPSANYATAREQAKRYFESLMAKAALVDSSLTRLARMFSGSEGVTVSHDFSGVEALQESRDARVNRVNAWWLMGVPLTEAAALEGFDEITQNTQAEEPPPPEDDQEERRLEPLARWLLLEGGQPYQAPQTEDARAELWRAYINRMHQPHERRIGMSMRRYLRAYAARIAKRLEQHLGSRSAAVPVVRQLDDVALDKILDAAAERQEILGIFRPLFRAMLADSIRGTVQQLPIDFEFTPDRLDILVNEQIGGMITDISKTTRAQVKESIRMGLAEGESVGQIQRTLVQSKTFSPARALTIARTESTRAVSAGSLQAMKEAEARGVRMQKQWISARDGNERDSHMDLDGKAVNINENFTSINGNSGPGPGQLGAAEDDINCRCVAVPLVEGVS
jgi:HK97 family phage portal protein